MAVPVKYPAEAFRALSVADGRKAITLTPGLGHTCVDILGENKIVDGRVALTVDMCAEEQSGTGTETLETINIGDLEGIAHRAISSGEAFKGDTL